MLEYPSYIKETDSTMLLVSIIPKIFERKIREYPSLAPIKKENKKPLRYKERESPVLHIEQVSKNLGEHGRLQILVEMFTG